MPPHWAGLLPARAQPLMSWKKRLTAIAGRGRALLRADLRDRVVQDSFVVLAGHGVRLALGVISSAVLARGLGPEGLSVFAVVGAATGITASVADLGLRLSTIRHVAANLTGRLQEAYRTGASYSILKVTGSVLATAVVLLGASPLAALLNLPAASGPWPLRAGGLAMLATMLSSVPGTIRHALGRFRPLIVVQTTNVALTVLLMSALWLTGHLDVTAALLVGGLTAAVGGLLGVRLLGRPWRVALSRRPKLLGPHGRRLLSFGRWLWVSNVFTIVAAQADVLLLNLWLPMELVGIYALARNLANKAGVLNQTLHTVLAPKVSALQDDAAYVSYGKRTLGRSLLLAASLLLTLPLVRPFILLVYGQAYEASVNVFYALMAVVVLDLLASPLALLALPMDRPRLLALAAGLRVLLLVAVGTAAVPIWGVYGIVLARLVAKIGGSAVTLLPIARQLRRGTTSSAGRDQAPPVDRAPSAAPRDPG
jgi:O-antigen/teichoic acid export membrane protein